MHITRSLLLLVALTAVFSQAGAADADSLREVVDRQARAVEPKVIAWRRDLHQNPELSNREVRSAKLVADYLRSLGIEVKTGVAHRVS
jgi:amidohydrolase